MLPNAQKVSLSPRGTKRRPFQRSEPFPQAKEQARLAGSLFRFVEFEAPFNRPPPLTPPNEDSLVGPKGDVFEQPVDMGVSTMGFPPCPDATLGPMGQGCVSERVRLVDFPKSGRVSGCFPVVGKSLAYTAYTETVTLSLVLGWVLFLNRFSVCFSCLVVSYRLCSD